MNVCKGIVPSRHGGTLYSRRAASPFVRLVKGKRGRRSPDHPQGILLQNCVGTELYHSVTCMVLKAMANDRRHLAFCHYESLGS
ncbi:uncharacterized protein TNCV_843481 [Trichonephila clavipes]|nr:uncharacterized protein TNCV_843481 [Trichonephila clavipes]